MNNQYCVYKHTSPSGKSYIGQTNNLQRRISEHKKPSNRCLAFSTAIQKHGWDNFKHEVLKDNLSLNDANYWESQLIKEYDTLSPNGYNLTTGGDNKKCSEETCLKIGLIHKGRKRSDETRVRIGLAVKAREYPSGKPNGSMSGRNHSAEAKAKMSESRKGVNQSAESIEKRTKTLKGLVRTDETKERIRQSRLGAKATNEAKANMSKASKGKPKSKESQTKRSETYAKRNEEKLLNCSLDERIIIERNKIRVAKRNGFEISKDALKQALNERKLLIKQKGIKNVFNITKPKKHHSD